MNRPFWLAVALVAGACEGSPSAESPPDPSSNAQAASPAATASAATRGKARPSAARSEGFAVGEGDPAPDVALTLHDGKKVSLSELRGQLVLVYFYPKDDTPGCTVEARGLRDHHEELTTAGVKVFGVSLQDASSHQAFIDKHDLPFPLVVDEGGEVAKAFDVPVRGEFAARHSFLIGKDGKISKAWRKVTPAGHAEEVLAAAKATD